MSGRTAPSSTNDAYTVRNEAALGQKPLPQRNGVAKPASPLAIHLSDDDAREGKSSNVTVTSSGQQPAKAGTKSQSHQRRNYVFADPVAFRYLEEDAGTVVIERRGRLKGYELYLVEQWTCSRVDPTFIIATYTGDMDHSIMVGVLGVPVDEEAWSPRLRVYFQAISDFHARPTETPLGLLMVTNLNNFPSALTVIPIPDGDVRMHREDFIVNENLKRLGCSGRSGMSLTSPGGATQAKFLQLYKTSDRITFYGAVIELVKLCQVALLMFGKLEQEYADGLLCDVTEKAIGDWWTEIGSDYFTHEPTDGVLGPTTVAALHGLLMGARNRLNYYGAPVSKDAFDVHSLKRGVAYFQKSQKMERTRRLDRRTLQRLHTVTAKAAAGEGWIVPKAVKSTVVELGGKGGEMMMGMVGRDKAGIGDIETLDIERFVSLVHGERAKWLWHGKPRRTTWGEVKPSDESPNMTYAKDDHGGYMWVHSRAGSLPLEEDTDVRRREPPTDTNTSKIPVSAGGLTEGNDRDQQLRKIVLKSVTDRLSDTKSGFSRIKDAVGLRGHASKHSKDEDHEARQADHLDVVPQNFNQSSTSFSSGVNGASGLGKAFTWKNTPENYRNVASKSNNTTSPNNSSAKDSQYADSSVFGALKGPLGENGDATGSPKFTDSDVGWAEQVRQAIVISNSSVAGSSYGDDLEGRALLAEREPHNFQVLLHRRHTLDTDHVLPKPQVGTWWPRCMSFSEAEEAVLTWEPLTTSLTKDGTTDNLAALQEQRHLAEEFKSLFLKISDLRDNFRPGVEHQVDNIDSLEHEGSRDQEDLQTYYHEMNESYQMMKMESQEIMAEERIHIEETIKDIEVLGAKLEYEINALASRVQDVDDGVAQFETQVDDLESRAYEVEAYLNQESWPHWIVRMISGVGARPINSAS